MTSNPGASSGGGSQQGGGGQKRRFVFKRPDAYRRDPAKGAIGDLLVLKEGAPNPSKHLQDWLENIQLYVRRQPYGNEYSNFFTSGEYEDAKVPELLPTGEGQPSLNQTFNETSIKEYAKRKVSFASSKKVVTAVMEGQVHESLRIKMGNDPEFTEINRVQSIKSVSVNC